MNRALFGLFGLALLGLSSAAIAQEAPAPLPDWYQVQSALADWRADHGDVWRIDYDNEIGRANIVYGGSVEAPFAPATEADWFSLAREQAIAGAGLTGIDAATLVEDRVKFLPLSLGGTTTDKMAVKFRQEVDGVPVVHGWFNAVFALDGTLLALDSTGLPGLAGFDTAPAVPAEDALSIANGLFLQDHGSQPTSAYTTGPELVIDQVKLDGKLRSPVLVWEVGLLDTDRDQHVGNVYRIDAETGVLVSKEENVHEFDVTGTVEALVSPGLMPDTSSNPESAIPMPFITVQTPQGNATTDANGNFTIVGANAPLSVTVSFDGTYHASNDVAGADYSLNTQLNQNNNNVLTMNPSGGVDDTAEANSYNWVHRLRDYIQTTDPTDTTTDFLVASNTNVSGTCNAFYDGFSINFFPAGGGCVNTAFSTVVTHEEGHWLNDLYGSGNGSDGFGEGNADMFAMYSANDPVVGQGFSGPGTFVRTGLNTRQWCGSGCYGQVHTDGEVWMGAGWKIRARMQAALGQSIGSATADALFVGWMNAFNQGQISPTIETQWLTLDDNDGNIGNGTPNYAHIDGGFTDQGFPGVPLIFVDITNVTVLGDTQNDVSPRTVNADMTTNFNPPVTSPMLHWRVDGGPFQAAPMTSAGGSTYTADIPATPSPAVVDYYVEAMDGSGQTNSFPDGGASNPIGYNVGIITEYFADSFESNIGWTHSTSSNQDDWQRTDDVGAGNGSFGKAGDAPSAFDGTQIWGNDLGPSGWNGFYQDDNSNVLTSPAINLSAAATPLTLSFQRWATVESGQFDQLQCKVNGQTVWSNPQTVDLIDTSWNETTADISFAAGDPAAVIEFTLDSDGGVNFGGWNIDDLTIFNLGQSGRLCNTLAYCTGKVTSIGTTPAISSTGTPGSTTDDLVIAGTDMVPMTPGVYFFGTAPAVLPFSGGTLCVMPPLKRGTPNFFDGTGAASWSIDVDVTDVGETEYFQLWARDPGDQVFGVALSNALRVDYCDD